MQWPAQQHEKQTQDQEGQIKLVRSLNSSEKIYIYIWADETNITFSQKDGKRKVWRRTKTAHDPKNITLSVKHDSVSIMVWLPMELATSVC